MMKKYFLLGAVLLAGSFFMGSCDDDSEGSGGNNTTPVENPAAFQEIASLTLEGGEGAAEISTFDPVSNRLFVVNNAGDSRVDVIDFSDPSNPSVTQSLSVAAGVNSVVAKNGMLAVAIEGSITQDNGAVVIFEGSSLAEVANVTVGALPDMVTFTPDGNYILTANEGEPNDDYSIDPVGSVSIISTADYSVRTATFDAFASDMASLMENGLRIFGPNASFTQDLEPEYIAVSADSQTAWVSLQENNGLAQINIQAGTISGIWPLGFKDYSLPANAIDVSDRDDQINLQAWDNVVGMYQPDAIEYFEVGGTGYIITANEGDARDYDTFSEEERVKDLTLDPAMFPNAAALQEDAALGRLEITSTLGDIDEDGDYDLLYSYGARSFSIWSATDGSQIYDSGNEAEAQVINNSDLYQDSRSDAKGVEPEGVTVGIIDGKPIAFIGLERVDAVLVYDISNPSAPLFLQLLEVGDAPEGILFISADDSPTGNSLLIVSSEDDGVVKVFQPDLIMQ